MSDRRKPTIGVLVGWQAFGGTFHSFVDPLFYGIRSAAHERGCNLLLACGVGPYDVLGGLRPAWPILSPPVDFIPVGPWNTDGLIVVTPVLSEVCSRYIHKCLADGHPVVFAGPGGDGPTVAADNEKGIHQAVAHLAAHGHRRIAFIAGHPGDQGDSEHRLRAYLSAIEDCDLDSDPALVAYGSHVSSGGRRAMKQILDSKATFTAVLASNDKSAFGAMQALREAGLRIPDDVAVVGFDDELEARAQEPPLTTVRYPTFQVGHQALESVLEYVEGGKKESELVQVPARLVIRQSCGCRPGAALPEIPHLPKQQRRGAKQAIAKEELAQKMAEAVLDEVRQMSLQDILPLCQCLIEAFSLSLAQNDATHFHMALEKTLRRAEEMNDEAHAWQAAITALEAGGLSLLKGRQSRSRRRAEGMLNQARIIISENARWRHLRHAVRQADIANQLGWANARFILAQDESQMLQVLEDYLPGVDVQHAHVAFFEAEGDDPVAWSILHTIPGTEEQCSRFSTRQFPPQGLYPAERPFQLALLPLVVQEKLAGFVAFDARNLAPCAAIVRQLASAYERLQAENALKLRVKQLAALSRTSQAVTASLELEQVLGEIVSLASQVVPSDYATVVLVDESGHIGQSVENLPGLPTINYRSRKDGLTSWIARSRQLVLIDEIGPDGRINNDLGPDAPRFVNPSIIEAGNIHAVVGLPLVAKNRLLGVLYLHSTQADAFHDQLVLLTAFANQAATAIENAQLYATEQQRVAALARALEQQQELDRLKSEFIQNVSHELRSPLALIYGYAQLLYTGELGHLEVAQQNAVTIIARRARMLSDLVQDITLILETEVGPPKPETIPLDELTQAAIEDFQLATDQADLTLRAEIAPDLPPVQGTYTHLRRVLDNLLGNALKFTPAGGAITVRLRQEGEEVMLAVSDTGIGIPKDQLGRVFDRFYQVDGSIRRRYGGVGLGLALVKEIVESFGGRVAVESQQGAGTTFTIWLPVAKAQ